MKKAFFIIVTLLVLSGIAGIQRKQIKKLRNENFTLNNNVTNLIEQCKLYQVRDSLQAASVGMLELQVAQYKKWRKKDAELIEDLNIKLKRVQSVSSHALTTSHSIKTIIRDTIITGQKDSVQKFSYKNPYINLNGTLRKDSLEINLASYDTLKQVVHRIPKKFLFIKYGTKAIRQEIVSTNPHTKITYTEYIQIKKQ